MTKGKEYSEWIQYFREKIKETTCALHYDFKNNICAIITYNTVESHCIKCLEIENKIYTKIEENND